MKKIIVMSCVVFSTTLQGIARDNQQAPARAKHITNNQDDNSPASARAKHLSDKMIRELRLNNFQAKKVRAINNEKMAEMVAIESQFANDPALVENKCKGVCKERDKALESFLSSEQYSKYYASRTQYNNLDKAFAMEIGALPVLTAKNDKVTLPIGDKVASSTNKRQTIIKQDDNNQ